jgi:hypothetical protein
MFGEMVRDQLYRVILNRPIDVVSSHERAIPTKKANIKMFNQIATTRPPLACMPPRVPVCGQRHNQHW